MIETEYRFAIVLKANGKAIWEIDCYHESVNPGEEGDVIHKFSS